MSGELRNRLVRRTVVLAMTLGVIGVGVATVQTAAQWRAASAPLDVAPVSMDSLTTSAANEAQRTEALSGQIDDVASQIVTLNDALTTANQGVAGDATNAQTLKAQLASAKAKLQALQSQLQAAQARLSALNAAAARQAAINAAAARAGTTTTSSGGEHEGGDDGH